MENRSHTRSIIEEDVVWAAEIDPNSLVDAEGNRLIHLAASCGFSKAVSALIEHGADLNAINKCGEVASVIALKKGHASIAFTLRAQQRVAQAKASNAPDLEQVVSEAENGRSTSVLRDAGAPSSRSMGSHHALATPTGTRSPVGHFAPTSETALMASDPDWQPPAIDALGSTPAEVDSNSSSPEVGANSKVDDEFENFSAEEDVAHEEEEQELGSADGGQQEETESSLDWLMSNYTTGDLIRTFSLRVNNSMQNIETLADRLREILLDWRDLSIRLSYPSSFSDDFSFSEVITEDMSKISNIASLYLEKRIDTGRIEDEFGLRISSQALEALDRIGFLANQVVAAREQEKRKLLDFVRDQYEELLTRISDTSKEVAFCTFAISEIADYVCVDDIDAAIDEAVDYVMLEPGQILLDPISNGHAGVVKKMRTDFGWDLDFPDDLINDLKERLVWDDSMWES